MKCAKCGSIVKVQKHHVTYEPEQIEMLCLFHHSFVTSINTRKAKFDGMKKLTNEKRIEIHNFVMNTPSWILEAIFRKRPPKIKKKSDKSDKSSIFGYFDTSITQSPVKITKYEKIIKEIG